MEAKKYREEILRRVEQLPDDQLAKVISLLDELGKGDEKSMNNRKALDELRGKYKNILPSSEEFMKRKEEEKKLDR